MKKHLGVLAALALLTACAAQAPTTNSTPSPMSTSNPMATSYTLADVSAHAKGTDCWMVIKDKVYNVTPFIASGQHPGGDDILKGCGKDATSLFEARQEPGEPVEPHSQGAHDYLVNFYIGDLKK